MTWSLGLFGLIYLLNIDVTMCFFTYRCGHPKDYTAQRDRYIPKSCKGNIVLIAKRMKQPLTSFTCPQLDASWQDMESLPDTMNYTEPPD